MSRVENVSVDALYRRVVQVAAKRRACLMAVALSIAAALSGFPARADVASEVAGNAVRSVYEPAFAQFAERSRQLSVAVDQLCRCRDVAALQRARHGLDLAVASFAVVELYRVGPMLGENRLNRLFFWPDSRRVGERQLRALLASADVPAVTSDTISGKSVALQGFPALERLLFDGVAEQQLTAADDGQRCAVATAVALNIATLAAQMNEAWVDADGIRRSMLAPSPDDVLFRNQREVLRSVMTQLLAGLDFVIDRKLAVLLPAEREDTRRRNTLRKAPLWKSGNTFATVAGNVNGLRALLLESGLAAQAGLHDELEFEFQVALRLIERLAQLEHNLDAQTAIDGEVLELLQPLVSVLRSIRFTIADRLATRVGVHAGFNSDDGD